MNKLVNILFVIVISIWTIGMIVLGFATNAAWYYGELGNNTGLLVMFWGIVSLAYGFLIGRWTAKRDAERTFKQFGRPIVE